jgi:predicted tellurium resistance membrane protein TerC
MSETQSVTSIGQSPESERKTRMIKYLIAMIIRMVCLVLALVVQGWLAWVFAAGAVLLPYFAVVLANAVVTDDKPKLATAVAPKLVISADQFAAAPKPEENH